MSAQPEEGGEPTALYRTYDTSSDLLYVGISNNFGTRWKQHAKTQPWWPEVQRLTVEWYPNREDAEAAEVAAIGAEQPKYNIRHAGVRKQADPQPVSGSGTGHCGITRDLREQIVTGALADGSVVPGEDALVAHYGVSRTTARQALDTLKHEGLIVARRGSQTRVRHFKPTKRYPLARLTEDDLRRGATDVAEEFRVRMPSPEEVRRMDLPPGTPVIEMVRRTATADGAVIELNRMVLDASDYVLVPPPVTSASSV